MTTKLFVYCYVCCILGIDDLLLTIIIKLLLFSILSIELYTWLLFVYHNLCIEKFQICILCLLYGKIRQLDLSPSFANADEQVSMVNFAKKRSCNDE
jgi:hypothetical protein